jgi:hypothetical protein
MTYWEKNMDIKHVNKIQQTDKVDLTPEVCLRAMFV